MNEVDFQPEPGYAGEPSFEIQPPEAPPLSLSRSDATFEAAAANSGWKVSALRVPHVLPAGKTHPRFPSVGGPIYTRSHAVPGEFLHDRSRLRKPPCAFS